MKNNATRRKRKNQRYTYTRKPEAGIKQLRESHRPAVEWTALLAGCLHRPRQTAPWTLRRGSNKGTTATWETMITAGPKTITIKKSVPNHFTTTRRQRCRMRSRWLMTAEESLRTSNSPRLLYRPVRIQHVLNFSKAGPRAIVPLTGTPHHGSNDNHSSTHESHNNHNNNDQVSGR